MRIAEIASGVMIKLAALPGLRFLQRYVIEARGMKSRFGQRKGDYEAYLMNARGAMEDIRGESKDSGDSPRQEHGEAEDHSDYDWYDEFEQSGRSSPGNGGVAGDDYPNSDDNMTYYDDDYRT